jgi:hypothetical protein
MAPRLTTEDRLQRLVAKCRSRVDALEAPPVSLSHTPDSTLGRLAREAGYERISGKFCEQLHAELRDAGLGAHPELIDPMNTRHTRIYFFDLDHPLPGIQPTRALFQEERQLSDFLVKNFAVLSYVRKNGLTLRRSEARIAAGCVVDLLAEDKKTRELVGFELKAEAADERVVAQAAKYMTALSRQAEKEDRPGARLLIVTGQPDRNLQEQVQELAATRGVKTEWLLYQVSVELKKAPNRPH